MKITKQRLKQIIREELENVLLSDGVRGDITRGAGKLAHLTQRLRGRTRGIDPPEDEPVDVASDEYTPKQYEYDARVFHHIDPRRRRIPDIPDEDLDPETGARKDLARKAAGDAGDVLSGQSAYRRVHANAKAGRLVGPRTDRAVGGAKRALDAAAQAITAGPGFIPDEDLPAHSVPAAAKRRIAKQKAMAKKR